MLEQTYAQWSKEQFALLKDSTERTELAQAWLDKLQQLSPEQEIDDRELEILSQQYTEYLVNCKKSGYHFIQPGRFVLPGELADAPILHFFPFHQQLTEREENKLPKQSVYRVLRRRFRAYKKKVVRKFYEEYFTQFDRQIVLIDCLQPLNKGEDAFNDVEQSIDLLMHSFRYGSRSLLRRLFSNRIDKVLFAATKADHITADQQVNLTKLLSSLVKTPRQQLGYDDITYRCSVLSSIKATEEGAVKEKGQMIPVIKGTTTDKKGAHRETLTLFPGEVPEKKPNKQYWTEQGFNFMNFAPPQLLNHDQPLPHIRMDGALQFLIGDKLR